VAQGMSLSPHFRARATLVLVVFAHALGHAAYVNFEASHVHPIDLTPNGTKLLAVNTPDALLEVFSIDASGNLQSAGAIPVGLEPVTVVVRSDSEAWVVNQLSDSVSIVDLAGMTTIRTLAVGDEPMDVAFAQGKAFVAVSHEDAVKVYDLSNLDAAPVVVKLFGSRIRALAV
jgi:YVTN family beta-propeller protein